MGYYSCIYPSAPSVRPVEGGPLGLIDALRDVLGPDGTLVMPSWTELDDEPFDAGTTPSARDLGVVAQTFWRLPGVRRSDHFHAFAAVGPQAAVITADPLPLPPHIPASPVGRVHDLDGQVLLLGVGHDANTTLHLAELIAGVALENLARDPLLFLHPIAVGCEECDAARQSAGAVPFIKNTG